MLVEPRVKRSETMNNLISLNSNNADVYISEFVRVANSIPAQAYPSLLGFDSTIYLNHTASRIGYISQLDFRIIPEAIGQVEVISAPLIGSISHLGVDILDLTIYSSILAEYNLDPPALKRALGELYDSDGYALGLDITLKTYQMSQYAVINQSVARMGGLFFSYASVCLEVAQNLYNLGEVKQSVSLLKHLSTEAEVMQEVFLEPRMINSYLPVPIPFTKLVAIGLCTGIGLFVTMNVDKCVPVLT